MQITMRFSFPLLLLAVLPFTASLHAQATCNNPETANCTVSQTFEFYRNRVGAPLLDEVVNANRAQTAPDAFAARVHNSYQDFLNLFNFAVSDVQESENGQALIVRFNPLRKGRHLVGLTLTATKPVLLEDVKNAIPEASRAATVAALEKTIGDTDDLTWSGSYSSATPNCKGVDPAKRCWGRTPETYRDLLSDLLPLAVPRVDRLRHAADLQALFPQTPGGIANLRLGDLTDPTTRPRALELAQLIAAGEKIETEQLEAAVKARHLHLLPTLIDNQPQITGTVSYRSPGALGGANATAATVEVHFGRENLNSVRKACNSLTDEAFSECLLEQLATRATNGISTDKFVFTASYKSTDDYTLATLPLDTPVPGFTPIDLKDSTELKVKAQGGRELNGEIGGKAMRADLAFEGIRTTKDDRRTANRWTGTLTLSVPLGENITVPISVRYANKPEFLGDVDDRIGAHLGLTYRLPDLFGKKK